jgi:hypothetical protein
MTHYHRKGTILEQEFHYRRRNTSPPKQSRNESDLATIFNMVKYLNGKVAHTHEPNLANMLPLVAYSQMQYDI